MAHQETMTPRARVIKALNHEETDRIPIDLGGFQTGIHLRAYQALVDHLGFEEQPLRILDPVQQLAVPSEQVLQRFHVDIRYVTAHAPDNFEGGIEKRVRDGRTWYDLEDEFGVVWSMPEDQMLFMDISYHPLADVDVGDGEGLRAIAAYAFPDGGDPTRFTGVREKALAVKEHTPYALSSGICGVTYETCWYMRGLSQWFMDMIEHPMFCEALLDQTSQYRSEEHTS
jgi:uroporphyrinogen decarboxylase